MTASADPGCLARRVRVQETCLIQTNDKPARKGSRAVRMPAPGEITALLRQVGDGDAGVVDRLFPLIYGELQQMARAHRYGWRREPAVGTKSLVHEAYLKLVAQDHIDWRGRAQFFSL